MAASTALASEDEVRAFIDEYYKAWGRTDEDHILSYYTEGLRETIIMTSREM